MKTAIELQDGETIRHLKYDLNALCEIEEATGKDPFDQETWANPRPSLLRAFLWAGLVHEDETLTVKDVGAMVPLEEMLPIVTKVAEAIASAVGSGDIPTVGDSTEAAQKVA